MNKGAFAVVDLFCGAGGMSEGFRMAGFKIILGVEFDPVAAETFKKNNPKSGLIIGDIRNISNEDIISKLNGKSIDVVVGGPPCQGFSNANRRKKRGDTRNRLYLEFVRIVKLLGPRAFVIENVRGFASAKNKGKIILNDIKSLLPNYKIAKQVLLAADYGVPQMRRRLFIVGMRNDKEFVFPEPTHAEKWRTVRPILTSKNKSPVRLFYSKKLIDGFKRREKKNSEKGFGFRWQFLNPDKPSYTIPARYYKDGANALVKYSESEIRMLDTDECAKIQSFPDGYAFFGSKRQVYRQIGNAVPPKMANAIAKKISAALGDEHDG